MSKYHNRKVVTYEGTFDSVHEYERWIVLKAWQRDGKIKDLKRQVPYMLIPAQRADGKVVERSCSYIADFTYRLDDQLVVEDAKGKRTAEYIIKRKLMLFMHGIRIKEV